MRLVGTVENILGRDKERTEPMALAVDVRTRRNIEQCVGGRSRLRLVGGVGMALPQVTLQTSRDEGVVQPVLTVAHNVEAQIAGPTRSWSEGQEPRLVGLVQLSGVDQRKGVLEVQRLDGVDVEHRLPTPQTGMAGLILEAVGRCRQALEVDIVADVAGKERELSRNHL